MVGTTGPNHKGQQQGLNDHLDRITKATFCFFHAIV